MARGLGPSCINTVLIIPAGISEPLPRKGVLGRWSEGIHLTLPEGWLEVTSELQCRIWGGEIEWKHEWKRRQWWTLNATGSNVGSISKSLKFWCRTVSWFAICCKSVDQMGTFYERGRPHRWLLLLSTLKVVRVWIKVNAQGTERRRYFWVTGVRGDVAGYTDYPN